MSDRPKPSEERVLDAAPVLKTLEPGDASQAGLSLVPPPERDADAGASSEPAQIKDAAPEQNQAIAASAPAKPGEIHLGAPIPFEDDEPLEPIGPNRVMYLRGIAAVIDVTV
ncbi:MAG: hypothetical protein ACRD3W_26905, partial [Terriglobales bacterium]